MSSTIMNKFSKLFTTFHARKQSKRIDKLLKEEKKTTSRKVFVTGAFQSCCVFCWVFWFARERSQRDSDQVRTLLGARRS